MRLDDDLNETHVPLAATDCVIHLYFCGDRNRRVIGLLMRVIAGKISPLSAILRSVCRVLRIPYIGFKSSATWWSDITAERN